jgi:peptide chain release factor subunit 1
VRKLSEKFSEIRKLISELESFKGRHTELISVYVPAGYNLVEVINQLAQEKSTAANIKSKTTRKNVLAALEKIIQHLRLFKETPPNGLVIFCGNVSRVEGREDIRLWSFEPPEKMNVKIYWCDQVFVLDPLKELVREKEVFGLIVLDAREATIGLLRGKNVVPLKHLESTVPSKTVKGGMSQARYDRLREDAINEFLTKVGEKASELFLEQKDLKGVLVGGPGPIKERFVRENYLNYQIQKKLLGVKDVSYTDEYGLKELVNRSQDLLEKTALAKERELMGKFFSELGKGGNVVYGSEETSSALEKGMIETLLISEDFDLVRAVFKCQNQHKTEKILPKDMLKKQRCEICKNPLSIETVKNLSDELSEKAKELGVNVEFISSSTDEGKEFKKIGGIGGFLRFKTPS